MDLEAVLGFAFAGSGSNVAVAFAMLKDRGDRDRDGGTAAAEVASATQAMPQMSDVRYRALGRGVLESGLMD